MDKKNNFPCTHNASDIIRKQRDQAIYNPCRTCTLQRAMDNNNTLNNEVPSEGQSIQFINGSVQWKTITNFGSGNGSIFQTGSTGFTSLSSSIGHTGSFTFNTPFIIEPTVMISANSANSCICTTTTTITSTEFSWRSYNPTNTESGAYTVSYLAIGQI
jgi:hypothetical protein